MSIDQALEAEGFKMNRQILSTPEDRLRVALHLLSTDIILGEMYHNISQQEIAALKQKESRLKSHSST